MKKTLSKEEALQYIIQNAEAYVGTYDKYYCCDD